MRAVSPALYVALAGAALQFVSLGTDSYLWQGRRQPPGSEFPTPPS